MLPFFLLEDSMSSTGSIDAKLYILHSVLTNTTSYPYDPGNLQIYGISISNNDDTNKLTITLSYSNGYPDTVIPVAPGKNFESRVYPVSSINKSGSVTDFEVALFERG